MTRCADWRKCPSYRIFIGIRKNIVNYILHKSQRNVSRNQVCIDNKSRCETDFFRWIFVNFENQSM
jgi:hypothetical protein